MVVKKHKDRKLKKTDLWYYEFQFKGVRKKQSGFKSKQEAERAEALEKEKIRRQLSGEYEVEENMALYIQNWLDGRRNLQDNTINVYRTYINNYIIPYFKDKQVNKIKPIDVKNFLDSMHDKGLSSATIKKTYNILNKFFNDQVKMKMLKENPCDLIEKPREQSKEIEVFDENELKQFLEFAEGYTRYAFAFKLAAYTGLRRGELLALRWQDIDLERKIINVRNRVVKAKLGTDEYLQAGTKTSNGRIVSFSENLKREFIKYKQIQQVEKETNEYEDNDLVICTQNGKFVNVDNLTRIFRNTLKASGINKKLSFHALRHTHATLMLKAGVPMKVVSERLGHSSIKVTMDTYAHLLPSMDQDAVEKFERLFD